MVPVAMKIVHVVYSMEMGGAEMLVAQLSRLQRKKGHKVTVCAYSVLGSLGEALVQEGIPVHVMGEAHPLKTMLRYLRLFRELRPDVVHCHNPAPTLQAALSARLSGASCVVATRHSLVSPPYDTLAEIKFSIFSRFTDWVAGICEITCTNLRGAPLASLKRITRVYNGAAPIERIATDLRRDDLFTLLFVGRVAPIKNLPTLVRAFVLARLRSPHLRLWIVGDGAVRHSLEELSHELGASEGVTFWGEQMETARFFSAADAVVMSSTSEGLPMSLLQGMSVGLPAVVTDVGGMREILHLSGGGLLVPVGDADAMADALVRLASDPALQEELGAKAKDAYEREFTLEQMEAAYAALYRSGRRVRPATLSH
jgi:glycosyltransferase involved in cell wall biosynthesis